MPGPILHQGASVQCAHVGRAVPVATSPRVLVGGMPVAMHPAPWVVTGCTLPPPPTANGPCITAPYVTSALRVFVNGAVPVLLLDSQAIAAPTGTPLVPIAAQTRVVAT